MVTWRIIDVLSCFSSRQLLTLSRRVLSSPYIMTTIGVGWCLFFSTTFPTSDLPRNLNVYTLESTALSTQVRSIVCTATLCILCSLIIYPTKMDSNVPQPKCVTTGRLTILGLVYPVCATCPYHPLSSLVISRPRVGILS